MRTWDQWKGSSRDNEADSPKSEIRNPKSEIEPRPLTPALSPSAGARENLSQPSAPQPRSSRREEADSIAAQKSQSLLTSAPTVRALDLEDYDAIGRMREALSRHADEIFDAFASDLYRSAAAGIFKALTERGADGRGIRRPTRLSQLTAIAGVEQPIVRLVIEAFRAPGVTFLMPKKDMPEIR